MEVANEGVDAFEIKHVKCERLVNGIVRVGSEYRPFLIEPLDDELMLGMTNVLSKVAILSIFGSAAEDVLTRQEVHRYR